MKSIVAFAAVAFAGVAQAADWNYNKLGADWGQKYELCDGGKEQSPINLEVGGTETSSISELEGYGYVNYSKGRTAKDTGYTIELPTSDQGELQVTFPDGSKSIFTSKQWHFHAPSEHTVNGRSYDLEMHIVHEYKDQPDQFGAVLGIFFDRSAGNFMNDFIESLKVNKLDGKKKKTATTDTVNLSTFLSQIDMTSFWTYPGSLTTPPCSQGIKWNVLEQVQPISDKQLKEFTKLWADKSSFAKGNGNNRELQSLNARTVHYNSGAMAGLAASTLALAAASLLAF